MTDKKVVASLPVAAPQIGMSDKFKNDQPSELV